MCAFLGVTDLGPLLSVWHLAPEWAWNWGLGLGFSHVLRYSLKTEAFTTRLSLSLTWGGNHTVEITDPGEDSTEWGALAEQHRGRVQFFWLTQE